MLKEVLEGLFFLSGEDGLTIDDISYVLDITKDESVKLIEEYKNDLENMQRGLKLVNLGNSYKLSTKEEHKKYYEKFAGKQVSQPLSQSSLEVLAIVAYKEPITVGQIDEIRGVQSREMVRKLLLKGLIDYAGKSTLPGKPMLYKTTNKFLDYFNLSSKEDLPKVNFQIKEEQKEEELFDSKYTENE